MKTDSPPVFSQYSILQEMRIVFLVLFYCLKIKVVTICKNTFCRKNSFNVANKEMNDGGFVKSNVIKDNILLNANFYISLIFPYTKDFDSICIFQMTILCAHSSSNKKMCNFGYMFFVRSFMCSTSIPNIIHK